ncbi:hypothetical protein Acr_14g0006780 [Actinidia rufa]|uniref:Uncharacterized protein n=1 Tax=Actinidia rufa TaxID=165716 RepID=A0A7J0FQP1_9ERIC|nr:hypothetical protein Acr_14g0006780 [Actinidia rufa]
MFANAMARTDVMPVGCATGTTGINIVKQRKIDTADVPSPAREIPKNRIGASVYAPGPSKNNDEVVTADSAVMNADNNSIEDLEELLEVNPDEVESREEIEAPSHALGEDESVSNLDLRQKALEKTENTWEQGGKQEAPTNNQEKLC